MSIMSTRRSLNTENGSCHSRSQWVCGTSQTWTGSLIAQAPVAAPMCAKVRSASSSVNATVSMTLGQRSSRSA